MVNNLIALGCSRGILIHRDDNVAIARSSLVPGQSLDVENRSVVVKGFIPAGHKVAVHRIAAGSPVVRYGEPIGLAVRAIEAGDHVHTHNLNFDVGRPEYEFPVGEAACIRSSVEIPTFRGFVRADGRVGTRNYIAVSAASNCAAHVATQIAAHFAGRTMPAGVDGVVAFSHGDGCGHSIGPDTQQLERTINGLIHHPNVAGAVIVGLGCEVNLIDHYFPPDIRETKELTGLTIQKSGGTTLTVKAGIEAVERQFDGCAGMERTNVPASRIMLGLNCGGSDAFSGVTANPALGVCSDMLAAIGASAVLAETPEIFGAEQLLVRRAKNRSVAEELLGVISGYKEYLQRFGGSFDDNPSPGNKEGGLSNIVEKSLGAVAKGGVSPLAQVLPYAGRVTAPGLVYMNTPGYDPVSITGLAAGGVNLIAFTTGRGSAIGFPTVPVLKIATNSALFGSMRDNMDVNAGRILDGEASIEEVGREIFDLLLEVASGRRTASERLGHAEFVPWRIGPVL